MQQVYELEKESILKQWNENHELVPSVVTYENCSPGNSGEMPQMNVCLGSGFLETDDKYKPTLDSIYEGLGIPPVIDEYGQRIYPSG